jgi:phage baseplate assembly protein W
MSIDIYSRDFTAPKYDGTQLEVSDELSFVILQIENILFTNRSEVLGSSDFGASLEELLFTTNANAGQIQNRITQQINSYIPLAKKYQISTEVKFFEVNSGTAMGALVDILVSGVPVLSVVF